MVALLTTLLFSIHYAWLDAKKGEFLKDTILPCYDNREEKIQIQVNG